MNDHETRRANSPPGSHDKGHEVSGRNLKTRKRVSDVEDERSRDASQTH